MFSCQFESPHLGIIPRLHTSCLDEVVFLVWASPASIWCNNKKRHTKWVPVIKYGKGGMDVLGPQHMMIIKPTNSNFSSSFYNYAYPQGNKRERFKIWAEGCGAIWQHKQNYLNTSETSSMHFLVSQKQAACVSWFLPAFSNHMWAQHVRSSLRVDSDRLCLLASSVFPGNKNLGSLERSYNEVPAGSESNIAKVVDLLFKWKNFLNKKGNISQKKRCHQQAASLLLALNCS